MRSTIELACLEADQFVADVTKHLGSSSIDLYNSAIARRQIDGVSCEFKQGPVPLLTLTQLLLSLPARVTLSRDSQHEVAIGEPSARNRNLHRERGTIAAPVDAVAEQPRTVCAACVCHMVGINFSEVERKLYVQVRD
jgi:hypothetical protein